MDISPVGTSIAMTAMTRQLQTMTEMQLSIMKTMAEGQEQMAQMIQAIGVGQHLDIQA